MGADMAGAHSATLRAGTELGDFCELVAMVRVLAESFLQGR